MVAFKYLPLNSPCIIRLIFGIPGLIPSDLFCNAYVVLCLPSMCVAYAL